MEKYLINPNCRIATINKDIYGSFSEHLGRCIYEGIYVGKDSMGHYNSFKTVVYIPSPVAARFTPEKLAYDYDYIEKYIGLDKVYLETWRDGVLADREQLKWIRDFFLEKGVEVAGGITATTGREMEDGGKQRLFTTWCYSNEAMREKMREISEYTASIYDEFILDDFFFTNCTCEECIAKKGDSALR